MHGAAFTCAQRGIAGSPANSQCSQEQPSPAIYLFRAKGRYRHHKVSCFIIFNNKVEIKRVMICPKSHDENIFF